MKARDLLRAVVHCANAQHQTGEQMIRDLSDEQLQDAALAVAQLFMFKMLKGEAVRRGVWDGIKKVKP